MIGLIINPNSRKNRHRRGRIARFEKVLGKRGHVIETPSVDAIIPALKTFAAEGRRYWIADGGDGALHWMINEAVRFFGAARAAETAIYMPTGGGSVDFVAKYLELDGDPLTLVGRLAEQIAEGRAPTTRNVPSLLLQGKQVVYGDESTEFRRYGFGTALAGYGANFYGPLYRGEGKHGPVQIARHIASAFGAAALRSAFVGPLSALKPPALRRAEDDYLRPLRAEVRIDDAVLRGDDGRAIHAHTALNCASLPLNLAEIMRVFPKADGSQMHVHAGDVSAAEMARVFPGLMTGRSVNHLLANAFDGPAKTLEITCRDGDEMTPVIDGELFYRITSLRVTMGPVFRMVSP
jgi:diacylglycerol kinase family enzyme